MTKSSIEKLNRELKKVKKQLEQEIRKNKELTEKNVSLNKVEEYENKFRTLVENSPNQILIVNKEGIIEYINFVIFRSSTKDVVGKNIFDANFIKPIYRKRFRECFIKTIQNSELNELHVQNIDDTYDRIKFNPLFDQEDIIGVIMVVSDITSQKQLDIALRESENKFRTLVENSPNQILVINEEEKIEYINFTSHSKSIEETLGTTLFPVDFIHPDHREIFRNAFFNARKYLKLAEIEIRKTNDTYIQLQLNPLVDDEKYIGMIMVSIDITRRKEMEQVIIQAQKLEAVGKLAGGIAHDYNNLLTIIMGQAELILQELNQDDSENRKRTQEIINAAERSSHLTRTLLTFSRQDLIQPQVINVGNTIMVLKSLIILLIKDRVKLILDIDEDFSAANLIKIDKKQLEQVILNLCINAYESMNDGGVLTITLDKCDLYSECINIDIIDTGLGIDKETQLHIFDAFFTTKETGAGLGLYTSKEIIESYNGNISVKSIPGKTVFSICLPITHKSETIDNKNKVKQNRITKPITILLVDDEEEITKLLSKRLQNDGHHVLTAKNGIEGLKIIDTYPDNIDLVITDIIMPEMSGIEMIKLIKSKNKEPKILLISGFAKDSVLTEGLPKYPFLMKPFNYQNLNNIIVEIFDEQ